MDIIPPFPTSFHSVVSKKTHNDGELTDSNITDKGYEIFTILVITEKNKNLFVEQPKA
jgi:hypothetical protein